MSYLVHGVVDVVVEANDVGIDLCHLLSLLIDQLLDIGDLIVEFKQE